MNVEIRYQSTALSLPILHLLTQQLVPLAAQVLGSRDFPPWQRDSNQGRTRRPSASPSLHYGMGPYSTGM
jgi:hypothetical protein